jgi:hypothetical protein
MAQEALGECSFELSKPGLEAPRDRPQLEGDLDMRNLCFTGVG